MRTDNRFGLKHILRAAGFLLITGILFVIFTYVFRNTTANQRRLVLSYQLEEKNTLDVVAIGASSTYRYWDPMRAWESEGITSFAYTCASMRAVMMETAIREVLRTQNPRLIMIDGRRFLDKKVNDTAETVRFYLDSLDIGVNRLRAVQEYCSLYDLTPAQTVAMHLDLCLYHNNSEAIADPLNWKLWDNRADVEDLSPFYIKGYGFGGKVKKMKRPAGAETENCSALSERTEQMFRSLMEYCSGLEQDVMVVISPFIVKEKDMEDLNTLEKIAAEYGIPFWNGNRYFDEIGVDFDTDFYNANHMNLIGAERYTDYLSAYIKEQYDLPDHRGEERYSSWDEWMATYEKRRETILKRLEKRIRKLNRK